MCVCGRLDMLICLSYYCKLNLTIILGNDRNACGRPL